MNDSARIASHLKKAIVSCTTLHSEEQLIVVIDDELYTHARRVLRDASKHAGTCHRIHELIKETQTLVRKLCPRRTKRPGNVT